MPQVGLPLDIQITMSGDSILEEELVMILMALPEQSKKRLYEDILIPSSARRGFSVYISYNLLSNPLLDIANKLNNVSGAVPLEIERVAWLCRG